MEVLTGVLNLVASIPGTFWGVLVGACFSLSGVALTNRASEKRLRAQFAHDRELRIAEREHALRKDVYLTAAEALVSAIATIARFSSLNDPIEDITRELSGKLPVIAKVNLIGGQRVVEGLVNAMTEVNLLAQKLCAGRIPLGIVKQQVEVKDTLVARWSSDRDRSVELMKNHNLSGVIDQQRWTTIVNQHNFEVQQFDAALGERTKLQRTLLEQHMEYTRNCIALVQKLQSAIIPVVVDLRDELGLPLDERSFMQVIEASQIRVMADFDSFLSEAKKYMPKG